MKGFEDKGEYVFGDWNFSMTRENKDPYTALAQLAMNLY
jgi:hypothetical protein